MTAEVLSHEGMDHWPLFVEMPEVIAATGFWGETNKTDFQTPLCGANFMSKMVKKFEALETPLQSLQGGPLSQL